MINIKIRRSDQFESKKPSPVRNYENTSHSHSLIITRLAKQQRFAGSVGEVPRAERIWISQRHRRLICFLRWAQEWWAQRLGPVEQQRCFDFHDLESGEQNIFGSTAGKALVRRRSHRISSSSRQGHFSNERRNGHYLRIEVHQIQCHMRCARRYRSRICVHGILDVHDNAVQQTCQRCLV